MIDCLACRWPNEKRQHTCAARTDPNYAQHVTPELAAWLAERHNPRFKPRNLIRKSAKLPKLSDKRFGDLWAAYGRGPFPSLDPTEMEDAR